ncbi:TA system antitoxin ParD family protein [Arthrobacter sp. TMN-50]
MTRTSQPTRLPTDVYESALAATLVTSRTVPQQIAHWARIGRELEMSPRVNHRAISQVLAGTGSYDSLGEQEQAIVREEWVSRMTARRDELDYAAQFAAAGESYSEVDDDGNLLIHPARG